MMKKFSVIAALIALAMIITACGGTASSSGGAGSASGSAAAPAAPSGEPLKMNLATGGTSGTYYAYGGVIAQVLNEKIGDVVSMKVTSTGASKANMQLIQIGDSNIILTQNDVLSYGYNGTDMFEGETPIQNVSMIATLYPEVVHMIVNPDKIKTWDDLIGKNISVSDAGSGPSYNAVQVFDAYGFGFEDCNIMNLSYADSAEAMKDGKIDAFLATTGDHRAAMTELATTYNYKLLEIDDEHAKILMEKYPFYSREVIKAGDYSCITEDCNTVTVKACLVVNNDVSEDVVYEITKALFEYKSDIAAGHAKGELLDPEYALEGAPIGFHPGAVKYYKEIGLM